MGLGLSTRQPTDQIKLQQGPHNLLLATDPDGPADATYTTNGEIIIDRSSISYDRPLHNARAPDELDDPVLTDAYNEARKEANNLSLDRLRARISHAEKRSAAYVEAKADTGEK